VRSRIETPREVNAFVDRLEDRIEDLVRGRDRVALAYSGGLASTLVAMVARKRCDLECVVAGSAESADIRAGRSAKQHMDYRIELLVLDAVETQRIHERLEAAPGLSFRAIRALIPLFAVVERAERRAWLTGFGGAKVDPRIIAELQRLGASAPLLDLASDGTVPRARLRAAAMSLGLPEEWARVPHRPPANGAGIATFL